MITIGNFLALYAKCADTDDQGWIMLSEKLRSFEVADLLTCSFIVGDDEADERVLLGRYPQFLEIPTFQDIIDTERGAGRGAIEDVAAGCLYYVQHDTFRD